MSPEGVRNGILRPRARPWRLLLLLVAGAAAGCARQPAPPAVAPAAVPWLGSWAAAQQLTEPRNMPPAPGLTGSTLRQVIHVTVGGSSVRVHVSNLFGDGPLTIRSAWIARSLGGSRIDPGGNSRLTFGGADSALVPAGGTITTDTLAFDVLPLSDLAVTLQLGPVPVEVTGHPGSRTTSYLRTGNWATAVALLDAATTDHWYLLAGLDVRASGAAVVTLGNSITDGRGSTTNGNDRWPDLLARRLRADARTRTVAVLNAGIGGNRVLTGGLGPTALARFDRDVLGPSGVRWVIVLEGVNDIGSAREPGAAAAVADSLIAAYRQLIERAHARGLRVYGGTITPFGGSQYDGPEREAARQTVNRWVRTSGVFDAVIDFDAAVRDPVDSSRLRPDADTGDHLHPNQNGYRLMADAIDLGLFVIH